MEKKKLHTTKNLDIFSIAVLGSLTIPFAKEGISAGFPSPAEDFLETTIDLSKELIKHPATTFCGKVKGNSMQDSGIHTGDIMIIDKSLEPRNGSIAVCYIDGEFTVKKIQIEKDCCYLVAANNAYKPIKVTADNDFLIWGIVTKIIKSV
ncbi:MAG TPA: translesion error-prone DNA polymerase V autoproteolytic subunit [Bacteroidia bacterium]